MMQIRRLLKENAVLFVQLSCGIGNKRRISFHLLTEDDRLKNKPDSLFSIGNLNPTERRYDNGKML